MHLCGQNYLASKSRAATEVFQAALEKLDKGEFKCTEIPTAKGDSVACKNCALKIFIDLAYQYRAAIPMAEFPDAVRKRGDCWWGHGCRTQGHNTDHAQRLNHICEAKKK